MDMKDNLKEEYVCEDCGLHYENKEMADECFAFCTKNNACSIEITKHSIEHKKMMEKQ